MIEATDLARCVPIVLHGDDAESHRRRYFTVCSFASVTVGHCSPWENRYVLYCIDGSRTCDASYDGLDSWLAWSFKELMHGEFDDAGPWGEEVKWRRGWQMHQPLAGGYRGILCFHRGDEKYLIKAYHFKTNWNSERVCWRCAASRVANSPMQYTYHGRSAPHRSTMYSLENFLELCHPNCWTSLPGFHPSMLAFDLLHIFDLTLLPDAAASVFLLHQIANTSQRIHRCSGTQVLCAHLTEALIELSSTDEVWQGASQDERLRKAHIEFTQLCKSHKIRS